MPTDKEKKEAHTAFPDPRCELHFERAMKPVADALLNMTATLNALADHNSDTKRTLHGPNLDNGMALAVVQHTAQLEELKGLPEEMRKMVTRWGFYLLGAIGGICAIATTVIVVTMGD